jgi:hypothetical protein
MAPPGAASAQAARTLASWLHVGIQDSSGERRTGALTRSERTGAAAKAARPARARARRGERTSAHASATTSAAAGSMK